MADPGAKQTMGEAILSGIVEDDAQVRSQYAAAGGPLPEGVLKITDRQILTSAVKWARETKTPLVPASSSAPHFQAGLSLPQGAWIADFSSMKRVMTVNRRNRVALFESGVTFEQLVPLARKNGLRVMLPLAPRWGKSALAHYLDRGPTIYPKYQWDLSDPLLCLEVVYGTGDLFRTGSAAGPGTIEEQWLAGEYQKNPMGPGQNDWMKIIQGAQGSIGLATWCSAKCEVQPEREELFVVSSNELAPLVRASYAQFYRKLTDIHFILDRAAMLNLVGAGDEEKTKKKKKKMGEWFLVYSVSGIEYFPDERCKYNATESEKELKKEKLKFGEPPGICRSDLLKLLLNPNKLTVEDKNKMKLGFPPPANWMDKPLGAHRSVYFLATLDKADGFMGLFDSLVKEAGIEADRVSRYIQPLLGGRCCHLEFIVAADQNDQADLNKVEEFCQGAAVPLIEKGAFFSRPHGAWAKPAMAKAGSSFWIYERMKDIFDPDHILAPGRLMLGGE